MVSGVHVVVMADCGFYMAVQFDADDVDDAKPSVCQISNRNIADSLNARTAPRSSASSCLLNGQNPSEITYQSSTRLYTLLSCQDDSMALIPFHSAYTIYLFQPN